MNNVDEESNKLEGMCPHGNFMESCDVCSETREGSKLESSKELIGSENYFGPEDVEKTFGITLEEQEIPSIPFNDEELEKARENGEHLLLRVDTLPDGKSLTLENLNNHFANQGEKVINESNEELKAIKELDMEYYTQEVPEVKWVLAKASKIDGTQHLSYDAQQALMNHDYGALEDALEQIPKAWEDAGLPKDSWPELPSLEDLKKIGDEIPAEASLPSAIEATYDLLLRQSRGESILPDVVFATSSQIQELPQIEEPGRRPIDVGPLDEQNGIPIHNRRSLNWGRPGALGNNEAGIPIAYTQR